MKTVLAWLAVTAFFVVIGLIAAGVVMLLCMPLVSLWPGARDEWWPGLIIGALAIAAAMSFAWWLNCVISRKPRPNQGRDPA